MGFSQSHHFFDAHQVIVKLGEHMLRSKVSAKVSNVMEGFLHVDFAIEANQPLILIKKAIPYLIPIALFENVDDIFLFQNHGVEINVIEGVYHGVSCYTLRAGPGIPGNINNVSHVNAYHEKREYTMLNQCKDHLLRSKAGRRSLM